MSNRYYNDLWREAQSLLEETTYADNIQLSSKPSRDRKNLCKQTSIIFTKYLLVINKLGECYDQMVHPQKRILIRKILDFTIIRYLELKHELVNLALSEFTYLDEAVLELNLIPQEIELKIPECYRYERKADIEWKNRFIEDTLCKMGIREDETGGIEMTEEEAILLIQRHERARQYRIRAQFMKNIRDRNNRLKERPGAEVSDIGRASALKIQRVWRGFITRSKIRKQVIEEMLLIGMLQPENYASEERDRTEKMKLLRYEVQAKHEIEFREALIREKEEIKKHRGDIIAEEIRDGIRSWYLTYKQQTGRFPTIPSEEHGGSRVVIGRQSPLPGSSEGSRSVGFSSGSKSSRSKKSNESMEERKKRSSDDEFSGFKLSSSNVLSELEAANAEYEEIWRDLDEKDNPEQNYVLEMVRAQKTLEVEAELRKVVDVQIRAELENLQAALERDEKGKRMKKAAKKKARRSGKKSKKNKKDKDLTPDRSLESLFEELVETGIIRNYPYTPISSFVGETSYVCCREGVRDLAPSLGDVRQVIKEFCILPMSSAHIHQNAPSVRSLLIAGPKDCGKDMLVNAICTELGAVLFDLSAANIVGKYPGKAGLVMLIHLINKVSKLLQPSIMYIDDAEKTFVKKVPKTDRTDPKRLKKDISKIVKSIAPNDLVMLIGVTHAPWDCDQKALMQTYNKTLMLLRPDYASVNMIWSELLLRYNAFNRDIDFCTLTKLSDGYTVGTLIKAVQRIMTCKRMLRLKIQPVKMIEILEALSEFEPVYKEEEEAFVQWFAKTPLGRSRQRAFDMVENEQNIKGQEGAKKSRKKQ